MSEAKATPKAKAVTPQEIHLRHLNAQKKSLEDKLGRVGELHPDMQGMSQALTEARLKGVKALIAKLSK